MDNYNIEFCRYLVTQKIEKKMEYVKDSINLMYRKVETLIDQDDQDYNYLAKSFGYKCRYVRNPNQIKFLFETFIPIYFKKGKQKIKQKEIQLKKKRINIQKEETKNNSKNDYMSALKVNDIETDDSMKDIDYRDINSDFSDDAFNQMQQQTGDKKRKKNKKKTAFLGVGQTQLEYYQDLAKKRHQEEHEHDHEQGHSKGNDCNFQQITDQESQETINSNDGDKFKKMVDIEKQKVKPKVFQIQSLQELEEIEEENTMAKAIRNKQMIENTINKLQKKVTDDNIL